MKRTPQYKLPFFQGGDLYSAKLDQERMIVIDNQLTDISSIVGDGVLSGWTVCHSGLDQIEVFPGSGFINGILNKTLSIKKATVLDNVSSFVYMQTQMINPSGGLNLETESPASNIGIATFTDTTPPATPTNFIASSADFNLINLFWDPNSETDFDHYVVEQAAALIGPYAPIANPRTNGVNPSTPFQVTGLSASTTYYFRLTAVDRSGNVSLPTLANAATMPDVRQPAEASGLALYPSNTTMSATWSASVTTGAVYRLTVQIVKLDGTIDPLQTVVYDNITTLYFQLTGLANNTHYRINLQTKAPSGVLSNGLVSDATPTSVNAPLDPILAAGAVLAAPHAIVLSWLASPSPTGSAIGQKKEYRIRVISSGIESAPIKLIGLALTKTVVSFTDTTAVGLGLTHSLLDNTNYGFRITTLDSFGNESAGLVVTGQTLDVTPPTDPRLLRLAPGDTTALATWSHSASTDVVGYIINIGFLVANVVVYGSDIPIGYVLSYALTGLTNGVEVFVKVRAKDHAGNVSSPGVTATTIPTLDITPPAIPTGLQVMGEDSQVVLSWNANTEPDFSHYIVQRLAVAENLLAIPGKNLTVITELANPLTFGFITTVVSTSSFASDNLVGFPSLVGFIVLMNSGQTAGQRATITGFNPANGQVILSTPLTLLPGVADNFFIKVTSPSLGASIRNVGSTNEILDVGLLNGQTYAYSVQSVDLRGNASLYSSILLVSPNCGLNDLNNPTGMVATFSGGSITLNWNQIVPDLDHPATNHTAFNIYRSTSQFGGFLLIDSVQPNVLTYVDTNLVNGQTYYYIVTAVRDNATIVIDNGAIPPPNTVLLATVKITALTPLGCNISAIQNEQRIVSQLSATIAEDTQALLLAHKHRTKPLNTVSVIASPLLAMIDVSTLGKFNFTGLALSPATQQYFNALITDQVTGKAVVYDDATVYAISPSQIAWNMPYCGDFQVLVNGSKPTVEFQIDPIRNLVIFPIPLRAADLVSLDGTGFSYYVPSQIDLDFRGFDIQVDGAAAFPSVDESLQTLRFLTPLANTSVVTVIIDPVVPDFGNQDGARQISLNPNIVLNDFTTQNGTLFVSASGAFDSTDTFFVLVDGARTQLSHSVDTTTKTITFDLAVDDASVVSLEILNREEVQGVLTNDHFGPIEASTFRTGRFLKAQLPSISHEGRIEEPALPIFQPTTTTDKYVYQAEKGIVGGGTTPYAIYALNDGSLLLGTSAGLMKASGFAAFTGEGDSAQTTVDYTLNPPSGLKFSSADPDTLVNAAKSAIPFSGRYDGSVTIREIVGTTPQDVRQITGPSLTFMDDGKILIAGGTVFNDAHGNYVEIASTWIYDPSTKIMTETGSLNHARGFPATALLPNGNILIAGGYKDQITHFDDQGNATVEDSIRLSSAEIYDIAAKTWTPTGDMNVTRDYFSMALLNDNQVIVAGGNSGTSESNAIFNPPRSFPPTSEKSSEIYDISLGQWMLTSPLSRSRVNATIKIDKGVAIITGGGQPGRELFSSGVWSFQGDKNEIPQNSISAAFGLNSIDGPVKQFLTDALGLILVVSRNNVFASKDGETYTKMKGLEAVGVVHRISQSSDNTLFAATDLGVYEITPDIHDQLTWFQGGLIGQGTTETFDLQPLGASMLAGTEIGIFSTSDDGNTWTSVIPLENVYNIKSVGSIIFATSNSDLYRSDDSGTTWTKVATLPFLDPNSKLIPRAPLDLFFSTAHGLFATRDAVNFFLVDFDKNRHAQENNVQMAEVIGTDLIVGYDNVLVSIGPALETLVLGEFVGSIPTVRVNGIEIRNGFRYDIKLDQIVFERKRLVNDVVDVTSNYGIYQLLNGPWYRQHPNAAVLVFVNGRTQSDSGLSLDSRLGQIAFATSLVKTDIVTVSIAMTTLKNAGEFYHSELEDKFEKEKGLPLSLGRDHAGNLLQMGLSMEHNFLERGLERNQYYCSQSCFVDRSFTSFLENAEFYIMGRREFDRFNSTIDYRIESTQELIGTRSLVPLSMLEVSSKVWIGTENGIFVLDPSAPVPFSITQTIQIGDQNPIRDMKFFNGDVFIVSKNGLYDQTSPGVFIKNDGNGLPADLLAMTSLSNVLILGTSDTIYYSDGLNQNPPYSIWFRANFIELASTTEFFANGPCSTVLAGSGIAYAAIGSDIFITGDGKTWTRAFSFDPTLKLTITSLASFAQKLYVGTNKGVYSDENTIRSVSPALTFQNIDATPSLSAAVSINELLVYNDGTTTSLYAVGNNENVYRLVNEGWTKTAIPGSVAVQEFIITSSGKQVAVANDTVYVQ